MYLYRSKREMVPLLWILAKPTCGSGCWVQIRYVAAEVNLKTQDFTLYDGAYVDKVTKIKLDSFVEHGLKRLYNVE
jgi:hypothetical protein